MEHRLEVIEERLAVLRERVTHLEAGARYSMTQMDLRGIDQRHDHSYHEVKASIAALTATLEARIKQHSDRTETLRYLRSFLAPVIAGLIIWAVTGSLELTKVIIGAGPK